MAIDLAIVFGLTGSGNRGRRRARATTGAQPGRLRGVDRRQVAVDEAELAQLLEALEDARQQRAAGDRRDDVLREPPAELLGDLEAVRLGALGVVGAQVDVGEPPAYLSATCVHSRFTSS